MKKILVFMGGLFLVTLLIIMGLRYQGQELDASGKKYVEENVPAIIATWSKAELLKRSSSQLLKAVDANPEQLDGLFQRWARLGAMRTLGDVTGDSTVSYTPQESKFKTAAYVVKAQFENGEAQVAVRLIQLSGQWHILQFDVDSPIFLQ